MPESKELATTNDVGALIMVTTPAEALVRFQQLQAFVKNVMVEKIDYGVIPFSGNTKKTLLQPGAQKLAEIYGFSVTFEDLETVEDWTKPFFLYRKRCVLKRRIDGSFVGDGIGSCNSMEDRYRWRWVPEEFIPSGIDPKTLKTRKGKYGGIQFRIPNEDIYSVVNTIEKIACKRSLTHAVIGATRSGDIFTMDLEDVPPEAYGQVVEAEYSDVEEAKPVHTPPPPPPEHKSQAQEHAAKTEGKLITEPQRKRLWAIAYKRGETIGLKKEGIDQMVRDIIGQANLVSTEEITMADYDGIISAIEAYEPGPEGEF